MQYNTKIISMLQCLVYSRALLYYQCVAVHYHVYVRALLYYLYYQHVAVHYLVYVRPALVQLSFPDMAPASVLSILIIFIIILRIIGVTNMIIMQQS